MGVVLLLAAILPSGTSAAATLSVTLAQAATGYVAATNKATVQVTVGAPDASGPWSWSVAVRGTTVATGSSTQPTITVSVTNDCSITTMSVSASVSDATGATGGAASTLDRSLCPPPPAYPHAGDRILAGPTLTEASFVDRLRAVGSPALPEAHAIYQTLVTGGVNPAFALAMFQAESHSGTRGYAVTTKNWGNILFYDWEVAFGATPYKPGNGYTYARYQTWLASVRAYVDLLGRYWTSGYRTVSSASARWLGTVEGSDRHLTYLNNIVSVMRILPDDAVPVMTGLSVPASGRAKVAVSWSARDNLAVTGYQLKQRRGTGAWSAPSLVTGRSTTLTLTTGTWTIAVRATDAAGNWSGWRSDTIRVDAGVPAMTRLRVSQSVVRSVDGGFGAVWGATDDIGVTRYQWRTLRGPEGAVATTSAWITGRSGSFHLAAGTWQLEVRARDAAGNVSPWRAARVVVPGDDRGVTFSSGTVRRVAANAYHRTLTTTAVAGARFQVTGDASGFVLVGRVGPSYGKLVVTVDGTATTIDTGTLSGRRVTAVHDRVLLFSVALTPGSHTVEVRNLGTTGRPTIALDALGFIRPAP